MLMSSNKVTILKIFEKNYDYQTARQSDKDLIYSVEILVIFYCETFQISLFVGSEFH